MLRSASYLDDKLKQRLRVRAAEHGRSMEAEARDILVHGVSASTPVKERSAAGSIRGRWAGRFQTDEILKMTRAIRHVCPGRYQRNLAAKAFKKYRAQSGQKDSPLPDFYIGAQAEDLKIPILTRDPTRFRYYFPSVECIAPQGQHP